MNPFKLFVCFALVVFLSISNVLNAQYPEDRSMSSKTKGLSDSTFTNWKDKSLSDSIRFYNLNWHIGLVQNYHPDSALLLSQKLLDHALLLKDTIKEIRARSKRASLYRMALKDTISQKRELEKSLELATLTNNKSITAITYVQLGYYFGYQKNVPKKIKYFQKSIEILKQIPDSAWVSTRYMEVAGFYDDLGQRSKSLENYLLGVKYGQWEFLNDSILDNLDSIPHPLVMPKFDSPEDSINTINQYYKKLTDFIFSGTANYSKALERIADYYYEIENYEKALFYYLQYLNIVNDQVLVGSYHAYFNLAKTYARLNQAEKSKKVCDLINQLYAENYKRVEKEERQKFAILINNVCAEVALFNGDTIQAFKLLSYGSYSMEKYGVVDSLAAVETYTNLGIILLKQGKFEESLMNCKKGEFFQPFNFEDINLKLKNCECIYHNYKEIGNKEGWLIYLEKLNELKDKQAIGVLNNSLVHMEMDKTLFLDSLHQFKRNERIEKAHLLEINDKKRTQRIYMYSGFIAVLISIGLMNRVRYVNKSKKVIEFEKQRSEKLLLNIIPTEIADELKEYGHAKARNFDSVTILFTDFQGFTETSSKMKPEDLVEEINTCFKAFDEIIEKNNIEKIKTIGDAYMAAGGLPVPANNSLKNAVLAALEMQDFITSRKTKLDSQHKPAFKMRIGIHTGPVVAGIVGIKKFQYDIWGDTVNTANRMESEGEIGKVNISQVTYDLIKDDPQFTFESRGEIEVKGKGKMLMYFVKLL